VLQGHGERVDQVEDGSHQADGGGRGDGRDKREGGQADGQDEDSARMCGGKGGEIHAERHSYLHDQPQQDGAVQDLGGQGEHVDVEVVGGGGEGLSKPSRRPVNWSVPRRRGLIPDGLVQARLSNFVV
jgi:hypothetical protein